MDYELYDVKKAGELSMRDYVKLDGTIVRITSIIMDGQGILVRGANAVFERFMTPDSPVNVYRKMSRKA